jgi:hypothetical protein
MRKQLLWILTLWLAASPALLHGEGAAISYQGRLLDGGQAANGNYDLRFSLTSTSTESGYVGPTLTNAPVQVENGVFTVVLDFGTAVFDGSSRWLEIGVRTNGSSDDYTVLTPRQPITAAPYALYALNTGTSTSGAGMGSAVYSSLSLMGTTNVVLYATNRCTVSTPADTNLIVVSGAGSPAANGAYVLRSSSPDLVYAKADGTRLAHTPDDPDYVWQILLPGSLLPGSGLLYGASSEDFTLRSSWVTLNGVEPAPYSVAYGVQCVTNTRTELGIAGGTIPGPKLGEEWYVNAAIGNDVFAQRGRPDLPFRTVYAALQAARTNDIVRVGPGVYNEAFMITLRPGVKLVGAGKKITGLYAGRPGAGNLDLSQSNLISDFSTDFLLSVGGYSYTYPAYGESRDARLENIEAYGQSDVVFCSWWQGFRAVNCDFYGAADCFADGQLCDTGTNAIAELYNCRLTAGWHALANYGRSQIRMVGGSIEDTAPTNSACVFAWDSGRPGASIELTGVSLRHPPPGSGGQTYAIVNKSVGHCTVTAKGMLLDPADVDGPVNYDGFGLTTNVTILGPDMATRVLCFTNGILKGVK